MHPMIFTPFFYGNVQPDNTLYFTILLVTSKSNLIEIVVCAPPGIVGGCLVQIPFGLKLRQIT